MLAGVSVGELNQRPRVAALALAPDPAAPAATAAGHRVRPPAARPPAAVVTVRLQPMPSTYPAAGPATPRAGRGRRRRPRRRWPTVRECRRRGRGDHLRGQLGFGGELHILGHPGRGAPVRVVGPALRQVQPRSTACGPPAPHTSNTLPLARFRSCPRSRCTDAAAPTVWVPFFTSPVSSTTSTRRHRRDDRRRSGADRRAPRRRPTPPATADAATRPGCA